MTWDELKVFVDEELRKQGRDGSVEVFYLDVTYPTEGLLDAHVEDGQGGGMSLS